MSENYSPGPGTTPQSPYDLVFLSQRDLGLQVPINYVTVPGVSFTAACFAQLRFEDDNSGDCLSNLLAVGFRRFEIDLYWDQDRKVWSFCPVAIPASIQNNAVPEATTSLSFTSSTSPSLTSVAIVATALGTRVTARQISSDGLSGTSATPTASSSNSLPRTSGTGSNPLTSVSSSPQSASPTSLGVNLPPISVLPDSNNDPLVSIGPYVCTTTINLSTLTSQLLDYIQKTENTLGAHLLYVTINIHAVASDSAPLSPAPAPSPSNLPQESNLLGQSFSGNLSAFLYTPSNLRADRDNLNGSWYTVAERYRPVDSYYSTEVNQYGIVSTDDGWPSENYIEFAKSKRLLLGWGSIDPQMSRYNFTGDESTIFPAGYIQEIQADVVQSSSDSVTNGCFLRNNTDSLSETNSSWAAEANLPGFDYPTSTSSNINSLLSITQNLTNCGISPILNVTLLNATALDNYVPYQNYSYSTIWSWAPNEPRNYSGSSDAPSDSLFRCATSNTDLSGRWIVNDCSEKYYAACRVPDQPYNWTINSYQISYSYASLACPNHYEFAAPRTALENAYLSQAIRDTKRDYDGKGVWVDFNSLDIKECWVSGGPNATCPYTYTTTQEDDLKKKTVLVPSLAALIVLVITALTLFVKVAGNRTVRKRTRKRANNGFIYEGVPS